MSDTSTGTRSNPLISSAADSPASRSAWPDDDLALAILDGSGQSLPAAFAHYDPATSSWRTSQASLFEGPEWTTFSATWPAAGTMRNGIASPRPPLVPRTSATGSSLWRTPHASDGEGGIMEMRPGTAGHYKLRDHVQPINAAMWPTPLPSDVDGGRTTKGSLRQDETGLRQMVGGQLNPTWVEWLMGFPIGWTDFERSATPSSPRSPNTSDGRSSGSTKIPRD